MIVHYEYTERESHNKNAKSYDDLQAENHYLNSIALW